MKHCNLDIIGYWVIEASCKIEKGLELCPSPPNCSKIPKIIDLLAYIYQLAKVGDLMSCGSEDIFKNVLGFMY